MSARLWGAIGGDQPGLPDHHLAAGGAKVVFLERGPWLKTEEFTHDLQLGTYTKLVDYVHVYRVK